MKKPNPRCMEPPTARERGSFEPFRYCQNHHQDPARRPMSFYVRWNLERTKNREESHMSKSGSTSREWALIEGKWELIDDNLKYLGPTKDDAPFPHGLALSKHRLRSGKIKASIIFQQELSNTAARILFGFNTEPRRYLSAGIGGYGYQYVISEYLPNQGWVGRAFSGSTSNIEINSPYDVEVIIEGQRIILFTNQIKVLEYRMPYPLPGDQAGLYAWGNEELLFNKYIVEEEKPKAFVVMQFGDYFDAIYTDVIQPVVQDLGMVAYRADDVHRPGIILKDIISGIVESEIIIAEITPPNANVFYELGYSHALDKQTILLAERGSDLPFDIQSYRCIFYDNTIKGKSAVETELRKHIISILKK